MFNILFKLKETLRLDEFHTDPHPRLLIIWFFFKFSVPYLQSDHTEMKKTERQTHQQQRKEKTETQNRNLRGKNQREINDKEMTSIKQDM